MCARVRKVGTPQKSKIVSFRDMISFTACRRPPFNTMIIIWLFVLFFLVTYSGNEGDYCFFAGLLFLIGLELLELLGL
jgi:hypothetical protein